MRIGFLFYTIECEVADVYHVTALGPAYSTLFYPRQSPTLSWSDTLVPATPTCPRHSATRPRGHGLPRPPRAMPQVLVYYRLFFFVFQLLFFHP